MAGGRGGRVAAVLAAAVAVAAVALLPGWLRPDPFVLSSLPGPSPSPSAASGGGLSVLISKPAPGQVFAVGEDVQLEAQVSDDDGMTLGGYADFGNGDRRPIGAEAAACVQPAATRAPLRNSSQITALAAYDSAGSYTITVAVETADVCHDIPRETASASTEVVVTDVATGTATTAP